MGVMLRNLGIIVPVGASLPVSHSETGRLQPYLELCNCFPFSYTNAPIDFFENKYFCHVTDEQSWRVLSIWHSLPSLATERSQTCMLTALFIC